MKTKGTFKQSDRDGLRPAELRLTKLTSGFLAERQEVNRKITIPSVLDQCDTTDRTRSLKLEWKPGDTWQPHHFYDSDVAKSLEAAAFSLQTDPDPALEKRVEGYAELFAKAQRPDGYLNTHYTQTGIEKRWTNIRDMHEMYCAGHFFEAAVAHFYATGRRNLLDVAVRYADHIDATFGPADQKAGPNSGAGRDHKLPAYPGHEEIELALVKLAEATGEQRYFDLAKFFIDERGKQPHYYLAEAQLRREAPSTFHWGKKDYPMHFAYYQAHLPVREQKAAEGHAVRACYLYSGMADVAARTKDKELMDACRRLFASIRDRRMYVTGGIGSQTEGERFSFDYDLSNEGAYTETCAAIALMFFASRMLNAELSGSYGDVMERALYNGVLGGVSLEGDSFFYANPLTYHPTAEKLPHVRADAERQKWYGCACCPPNIARLIADLGSYIYSVAAPAASGIGGAGSHPDIAVHLYADSTLDFDLRGTKGTLRQETKYPWDGDVAITVDTKTAAGIELTLALRIPAWALGFALVDSQGKRLAEGTGFTLRDGYCYISRRWKPGETLRLSLPMAIRRTYAHDAVRSDGWKVALERGPIVYCVEEIDAGANLAQLALPADAQLSAEHRKDFLGGCTVIRGTGLRRQAIAGQPGPGQALYFDRVIKKPAPFVAVPFALRTNRGPGEMRVWLSEV